MLEQIYQHLFCWRINTVGQPLIRISVKDIRENISGSLYLVIWISVISRYLEREANVLGYRK